MRTIVGLKPDKESGNLLEAYVSGFKRISTPSRKCDFHSTIYFSEEYHILPDEKIIFMMNSMLPLEIAIDTYSLDIFGRNHLMLRYESQAVREMEEILRRNRPNHSGKIFSKEHVNFNPHITIAKNLDAMQLKSLPMFDGKVVFDSILWEFRLIGEKIVCR